PMVQGDWTSDRGYEIGRSRQLAGATAVFAANDQMALGAVHGLVERGLRVPEDISVVGFDDAAFAATSRPPLTTVRQDVSRKGHEATALLRDAIERRVAQRPEHRLLPTELVVRASTAPARKNTRRVSGR
ncbi:MAG: substrate-binding domain-containing protein, partial [Actinobacteria bacterium]|nr:substrate-binding domain-containing protein [Actinomycetota bacterium]